MALLLFSSLIAASSVSRRGCGLVAPPSAARDSRTTALITSGLNAMPSKRAFIRLRQPSTMIHSQTLTWA